MVLQASCIFIIHIHAGLDRSFLTLWFIDEIWKHELCKVSLSLAKINSKMNSPSKGRIFLLFFTRMLTYPSENPTNVLIDGQPLVKALRKPSNCSTFDNYNGEVFLRKTIQ